MLTKSENVSSFSVTQFNFTKFKCMHPILYRKYINRKRKTER